MPAKNHLNLEQVKKLQQALKQEENGEIRERILILLLLNDNTPDRIWAGFEAQTHTPPWVGSLYSKLGIELTLNKRLKP